MQPKSFLDSLPEVQRAYISAHASTLHSTISRYLTEPVDTLPESFTEPRTKLASLLLTKSTETASGRIVQKPLSDHEKEYLNQHILTYGDRYLHILLSGSIPIRIDVKMDNALNEIRYIAGEQTGLQIIKLTEELLRMGVIDSLPKDLALPMSYAHAGQKRS